MFHKIRKCLLFVLSCVMKSIMGNNNNRRDAVYSFRVFQYEQLEPSDSKKTRVPLPRSGHRIVCDTKNLYSFGGYNPLIPTDGDARNEDEFAVHSFPLFQELWKFNFADRRWTMFSGRESLPQELASNAVVRQGSTLMVYGGTGSPFGHRCSNQIYLCSLTDLNGKMYEISTTGQAPLPQYGQALVYHNDYLYTIGGTTGFTYTCDIHRLNMKTHVWETVYISQGHEEIEPAGRYRHEVAFNGTDIFILGGGTALLAYDFDKLPVFNLEKREWAEMKTLPDPKSKEGIPQARRCHGSVQIETDNDIQVFISGGYNGEDVFDDLWKLDLKTLHWTFIDTCRLPYPTYFHSTAVTPEGKMYIFGGIFNNGNLRRNNQIHSTWLCIPKLSEMCWEALLFYKPEIVEAAKAGLLNDGLPRHFVKRLD